MDQSHKTALSLEPLGHCHQWQPQLATSQGASSSPHSQMGRGWDSPWPGNCGTGWTSPLQLFCFRNTGQGRSWVLQGLGRATTTLRFSGEEEKPAQVSCALDGGGEQTGTSLQSNVYAGKTTGIWGLRSPPEESSGPAIWCAGTPC